MIKLGVIPAENPVGDASFRPPSVTTDSPANRANQPTSEAKAPCTTYGRNARLYGMAALRQAYVSGYALYRGWKVRRRLERLCRPFNKMK